MVLITGPSSSGKTTTAIKVSQRLERMGFNLITLNVDNYFFDLEQHPKDEFGDYDFETPQALDLPLINEHLRALIDGQQVRVPFYDFKSSQRHSEQIPMKLEADDIMLIDSLHGMYPDMTEGIPQESQFRLYLEPLLQMKDSQGKFIRWADIRLMRRMLRDATYRAYDPTRTILHWHYVRSSEMRNIIPYITTTDYIVNSSMSYELSIYRPMLIEQFNAWVEQFQGDPLRADAYQRASRIYKVLQQVTPVEDHSVVPVDSVLREFIGAYGRVKALLGVDLQVQCGEIFGFLGPNGAGKTTTIRCLLDLIRPDGGTIRVLGIDPQKDPVTVRSKVGYLPGELQLETNFTVEGQLRYLNRLRGRVVDWEYVREIAQRIELDLKMPIKNLSKGNKQKVGVVQTLMHKPDLLMLDEPTFGLDPLMQQQVLRMIAEAQERGATIFFSSHILSEVQEIAERVAIIREGVVVEVAEISTLINRSLRRVRVRFREAVDVSALVQVPGVTVISQDDGSTATLQVEGDMDGLIKALAEYPVSDFETEHPSLEEIFLAYYESNRVDA
jgi:ABC-type multidrug transport system ATPase subunit/uridine kinase